MTLLIILIVSIAVLYGPTWVRNRGKSDTMSTANGEKIGAREVKTFIMKLIGGPADGHVEKIIEKDRPLFFVATYPPKMDENTGMPPEENIVGTMYGKVYVRPNYAYYRYIMDDEYIYVRDLEEKEVQNIAITGEQPEVKPRGHDEEDE